MSASGEEKVQILLISGKNRPLADLHRYACPNIDGKRQAATKAPHYLFENQALTHINTLSDQNEMINYGSKSFNKNRVGEIFSHAKGNYSCVDFTIKVIGTHNR